MLVEGLEEVQVANFWPLMESVTRTSILISAGDGRETPGTAPDSSANWAHVPCNASFYPAPALIRIP